MIYAVAQHCILDPFQDQAFSATSLRNGVSLHLLADDIYGQIVNMMRVPEGKAHPELSRIFENQDLWERRYILPLVRETVTDHPTEIAKTNPSETIKESKIFF